MARLHSRLQVPGVLRPFGEHLAAIVQPNEDDVCVDAGCDGAVMLSLLSRRARTCIGVDDDGEVVRDSAEEMALLHAGSAHVLRARCEALPLRDGCATVVTSLFALGHEPRPAASLRELLRVLDTHRGRLAVALWSEPDAAPHIGALTTALERVTGAIPSLLQQATQFGYPLAAEHLVASARGEGRVAVERVHDVVRFDGVAHWWAAMVADHPVGSAILDTLDSDTIDRLQAECANQLAPHAAADGTMRIPAEAVLLVAER